MMHETEQPLSQFDSIMLPKEEVLEQQRVGKKLTIGILGDENPFETRVPITPEGVSLLVAGGHDVLLQESAGQKCRFSDQDYAEAGAFVFDRKEKVFEADVLVKISPLDQQEIGLLRSGQSLISSLHLATRDESYFRALMKKRITAIAFELLQDRHKEFPVLRSMCEIAGIVSIGIGSQYLSNQKQGKGILLGGITGVTPTEVLILGAGTAAEHAARTAIGMGAMVKIFDNDIHRLQSFKHRVGKDVFTSVLHPPVLRKAFQTTDLVISTLQRLHRSRFFLVPEEMVMVMKKGSVVVDIHVDQGSSFETGELTQPENPIYRKHGVIHYMAPNMTTLVGRTTSIAISNVLLPLLLDEGKCGGVQQQIKENYGVREGIYLFNGILTQEFIGNYFKIPYKDINLLMAAF